MGLLDGIKKLFGVGSAEPEPAPSSGPSAKDVLREMKQDQGRSDAEWESLTRRFAVLVFSESDRQRLWKRAHRGADETPRLLSGIRVPTAGEKGRLLSLIHI